MKDDKELRALIAEVSDKITKYCNSDIPMLADTTMTVIDLVTKYNRQIDTNEPTEER